MLTSYKFWYITRDDDGYITECAIRYYEGEMQDVPVLDMFGEPTGETESRYIRTKQLKAKDLKHIDKIFKKEQTGSDVIVYTQEKLGLIKTDDELRCFLNGELKKDKDRTPNDVQLETDLEKIKLLKIK